MNYSNTYGEVICPHCSSKNIKLDEEGASFVPDHDEPAFQRFINYHQYICADCIMIFGDKSEGENVYSEEGGNDPKYLLIGAIIGLCACFFLIAIFEGLKLLL